jgi:cystathionine beta-lyase/cystathionine gamma-synthase
VLAETITNPLCSVPDLEAIGAMSRERKVPLLVDNTFATPLLLKPLELGATVVMHSATKYLGGHSDIVAGIVVGDTATMDAVRARSSRTGTPLGPFDAWPQCVAALDARMRRHSEAHYARKRVGFDVRRDGYQYPLIESSASGEVAVTAAQRSGRHDGI